MKVEFIHPELGKITFDQPDDLIGDAVGKIGVASKERLSDFLYVQLVEKLKSDLVFSDFLYKQFVERLQKDFILEPRK